MEEAQIVIKIIRLLVLDRRENLFQIDREAIETLHMSHLNW